MKAFGVGLLFVLAVAVLFGIGILLVPFLVVLGFLLRIIISLALVILAIWLVGNFILFVWKKLK